jgi:drug/metabolite transporter (DMT)-like permease
VGASFFYAAFLLSSHRARMKVDLLTTMTVTAVSSVLTLLVVNLVMGTALTGYGARSWLALLGLGLISQLGGWLSINHALGHLRPAPVSVCLLAQTGVTALAAMPILGEFLKPNQLVGGLVLLGGIYLVTSGRGQVPGAEKNLPG